MKLLTLSFVICATTTACLADGPTTAATAPTDAVASLQRMVRGLQLQVAELRDENQKMRTELTKTKAELAKLQPPKGALKPQISVGMTRAEAVAIATKNGWSYGNDRSERLINGTKVEFEKWEFSSTNKGGPVSLRMQDEIVTEIQKWNGTGFRAEQVPR